MSNLSRRDMTLGGYFARIFNGNPYSMTFTLDMTKFIVMRFSNTCCFDLLIVFVYPIVMSIEKDIDELFELDRTGVIV